jgi:hypothetical protein
VPSGAFSEGSGNLLRSLHKDFLKAEKAEPRRADGRGRNTERVAKCKAGLSGSSDSVREDLLSASRSAMRGKVVAAWVVPAIIDILSSAMNDLQFQQKSGEALASPRRRSDNAA